ncbi:MAG: diphthine--ammonia ligase [Oscillospiraceae bacterium]|nr:diphthine--ammonia ligase [Oscillospiraceae bacterium]
MAWKKFILSYSCGKDSTLCLHKMLEAGAEPMALLVMFNPEAGRSYFHGVDPALLREYGEALELPLLAVPTGGEEYHLSMEAALRRAKEQGAELVCFGDIDMENNRAWGEERCRNVGLEAVYPLWHHDRQENVREVLELGYRCLIKTLDRRVLPRHLLGRVMDRAMVEEMTACGVDVCGENGEFHTIAVDGPVFHRPIPYCVRQLLDLGDYSVADITVPEKE